MTRPVVRYETDVRRDEWDDPVRGRLGFRAIFSDDATPTATLTAGVMDFPPDGWLGLHRHTAPEAYFVVEGEAVLTVEGAEHRLTPGSAAFLPGDAEHGLRNGGESVLRIHYTFPVDSAEHVRYRFSAQS